MSRAILVAALLLPAAPAHADDDAATRARPLEVGVSGGPSWVSPDPTQLDFAIGGHVSTDASLELGFARAAGFAVMTDPTQPDRLHVGASGRLLFASVHDFTWRRTGEHELLRVMAGLGGTIGLPDGVGELDLGLGFAMLHVRDVADAAQPLGEAYGAYAGAALRLRFGPIRDELRVAGHATMRPPTASTAIALASDPFAALVGGVTASNRLYVEALAAGPATLGPELLVQVEQLHDGTVFLMTLGLRAALGVD